MTFLISVLILLFAGTGLFVLLSYIIAWYETANHNPAQVETRFAPTNLAFAAGLLVRETLSLALTVVVHPSGWLRERSLPAGKGRPILLLHGLFHNRSCWWLLKRRLEQAGLGPIYTLNLNTWRSDIEPLTELAAGKVDEIRRAHGVERVDLIGHSLGGLIARNLVQLRGGADKVRHCICIATPHAGSRLAPFALTPLARVLMPGSPFLQRLSTAELPTGVSFTSLYSRHDNLVIPTDSAILPETPSLEVSGIGHSCLLYSRRVTNHLIDILWKDTDEKNPDPKSQTR
ncbi:Triacylglycerol esterase/lipase EstA, alpha/beta hydrolase fold [Geoalkalibacter ferrihydriticus]|uniref:Triacylglycerol esterase/lipase EstA, alpha/beta hydrolase fold n=1 Tax=Geoalkalibacter ferrihydriticus TaxID=392333 RepID=A0A1G9JM74_9BACT|nr:alpha/beta fold hydrolase [Geoalkalibacter ferrihydriticus]SDL38204.1 Triacylglycerol esterase/lipase EstA, alpha/beta hydrolase fold [Geoalkalibacter ferrihydriticus]